MKRKAIDLETIPSISLHSLPTEVLFYIFSITICSRTCTVPILASICKLWKKVLNENKLRVVESILNRNSKLETLTIENTPLKQIENMGKKPYFYLEVTAEKYVRETKAKVCTIEYLHKNFKPLDIWLAEFSFRYCRDQAFRTRCENLCTLELLYEPKLWDLPGNQAVISKVVNDLETHLLNAATIFTIKSARAYFVDNSGKVFNIQSKRKGEGFIECSKCRQQILIFDESIHYLLFHVLS